MSQPEQMYSLTCTVNGVLQTATVPVSGHICSGWAIVLTSLSARA